jgi:hypothetical protein
MKEKYTQNNLVGKPAGSKMPDRHMGMWEVNALKDPIKMRY